MKMLHDLAGKFRRNYKRKRRAIVLSLRQQFILITLILTSGLLLTELVPVEWRIPMVVLLTIFAYLLTALVLFADLGGVEWLTILTLPTLFTTGIALFYFLLPVRWLTRLPAIAFYAIGMYALLLTANIYNVAANRTIALLRAAHSVGFLLSLVVYYFLIQTILSFNLAVFWQTGAIGIVSFFLILQALWAIELSDNISHRVLSITIALGFVLTEFAWVFYFWPVKLSLVSLFLTTLFYSSVGMAQQYLQQKLYKNTIWEFGVAAGIVLGLLFLVTRWRIS